jgi:nitric oxide reductase activation protein
MRSSYCPGSQALCALKDMTFLKLAETALQNCPQRRKFIVVLHDGDPVYDGADGSDLLLSLAHIRHLERSGVSVIGVYLGEDGELIAKLRRLFPLLIVCSNDDLPDRLGNLLRSLA